MPPLHDPDTDPDQLEDGIALSLSGGGYRAMIFHLGALHRLNEAALLPRIDRISSVSGGSIIAGALALHWPRLAFDAQGRATQFNIVADAVQAMASTSVDAGAILGGLLLPGTISDRVSDAYDRVLFHGAGLDALPAEAKGKVPRFVFNATNVQTGALWRFSRDYMGDYRVGMVRNPQQRLAVAVAASSAFPPLLSPTTLTVNQPYEKTEGADLYDPAYQREVVLSDGGVYDNLGLETVKRYRTLLVSDGGQKIAGEPDPARDWGRHSVRILNVVDNQVRSLRKRQLIDAYQRKERLGCFWGVRTTFTDYKLDQDPLGCAMRDPTPLAEVPTRLQAMPVEEQRRLANWGYAITDAALRKHGAADLAAQGGIIALPKGFPYPGEY